MVVYEEDLIECPSHQSAATLFGVNKKTVVMGGIIAAGLIGLAAYVVKDMYLTNAMQTMKSVADIKPKLQ
jgi:hypothetical protein